MSDTAAERRSLCAKIAKEASSTDTWADAKYRNWHIGVRRVGAEFRPLIATPGENPGERCACIDKYYGYVFDAVSYAMDFIDQLSEKEAKSC
jgi:hypothetical protein